MGIRNILILFSIQLGFLLVSSKTGPTHDRIVVCYLATWAAYRPDRGAYTIDNLEPNLCTHIVYAFSGLDNTKDAIKSLDPWQDLKDNYGKGGYDKLNELKKSYPHLKVTLAIGGWNEGSTNYSMMADSTSRRKKFVKNALEFVKKFKFDGLDLDWEYPAQRGGKPKDKQNFVSLVRELREEFSKHNLILTSAIGAAKNIIDEAYEISLLSKYLDFLHIMCYDYGGSWDRRIGANAPLKGDGFLTVEYTIEYLIKLGASPSKLILGIPFYGRTFVTNTEGNFGDPSDEIGFQGPFTRENGFLGYNEICMLLSNKSSKWTNDWDSDSSQAITRYKDIDQGHTKVVTYDSTRSVANKMKFLIQHGLGGAMVWSIDTDDFLGDCDLPIDTYADYNKVAGVNVTLPKRIVTSYPLLRTINEAILVAIEENQQEIDKENEIIPEGEEQQSSATKFDFSLILVICSYILNSIIFMSSIL